MELSTAQVVPGLAANAQKKATVKAQTKLQRAAYGQDPSKLAFDFPSFESLRPGRLRQLSMS